MMRKEPSTRTGRPSWNWAVPRSLTQTMVPSVLRSRYLQSNSWSLAASKWACSSFSSAGLEGRESFVIRYLAPSRF
jgi:hypothetical protein